MVKTLNFLLLLATFPGDVWANLLSRVPAPSGALLYRGLNFKYGRVTDVQRQPPSSPRVPDAKRAFVDGRVIAPTPPGSTRLAGVSADTTAGAPDIAVEKPSATSKDTGIPEIDRQNEAMELLGEKGLPPADRERVREVSVRLAHMSESERKQAIEEVQKLAKMSPTDREAEVKRGRGGIAGIGMLTAAALETLSSWLASGGN